MSKQNSTTSAVESVLNQVYDSLESFEEDYQNGKDYIYHGKEELWNNRYNSLREGLKGLNEIPTDRKQRKELEKRRVGAYIGLLIFHRTVELMKAFSSSNSRSVIELIDSMEWPDQHSKQRTLRQVLKFYSIGPTFFRTVTGDVLSENDRAFLEETISINSKLDMGLTYEEAVDKVSRVKEITISEDGVETFKGIVVMSEDRESFFGIGQESFSKKYIDSTIDKRFSSAFPNGSVFPEQTIPVTYCITVHDSESHDDVDYVKYGKSFSKVTEDECCAADVSLVSATDSSLNRIAAIKAKYDCLVRGVKYQGSKEQHRLQRQMKNKK